MSNATPRPSGAPSIDLALERLARFGCHQGHFNVVAVLTPLAPDVGQLPCEHSRRWRCFLNVGPRRAIAELLFQLRRDADDVEIRDGCAGEIVLATADPGRPRPLAFIWDLPLDAAVQALAELGRGMKP